MISLPFQEWFTFHNLVGGDWKFFWPENLSEIIYYTYAWDSSLNTGIGKNNIHILWLNSYLGLGAHFLTQVLKIPWEIGEKILFFWPILLFSFFSAFFLSKTIIRNTAFNILSGVIYLTNTYALMIFAGGQVGVALAYSIAPFVLKSFMNLIDSSVVDLKLSILAGLILAAQMIFDPRITVLSIVMVALYVLYKIQVGKAMHGFFFIFIIPFTVTALLHMFWILPMIMSKTNPLAASFSSTPSSGLARFFSFAYFENTLSLLHPNWPENIFGKIGFMKPEFILLPILAYASLFFIKDSRQIQNSKIIFFALLGILGAFLAKGTNPPFGGVYLWLTDHIELFALYRDSTKWYTLVAVSYSILIPYTIWQIYNWLKLQPKFQIHTKNKILNIQNIFLLIAILYLIFLIRPTFLGQIKGTFKFHAVPEEYVQLKDFLSTQPEFFRTLWVPKFQRFGFSSNNHPAVSPSELFGVSDTKSVIKGLTKNNKTLLQEAGIKYIVVPFDSESEIFLSDRKYDAEQYEILVKDIEEITFLKKIDAFGKIAVFEIPAPKERFFLINTASRGKVAYERKNPTKYVITVNDSKKGDILVFSEKYDSNWIAKVKDKQIPTTHFHELFNSFVLPDNGDYSLEIFYRPQQWVAIGSAVSLTSLTVFIAVLSIFSLRKTGEGLAIVKGK